MEDFFAKARGKCALEWMSTWAVCCRPGCHTELPWLRAEHFYEGLPNWAGWPKYGAAHRQWAADDGTTGWSLRLKIHICTSTQDKRQFSKNNWVSESLWLKRLRMQSPHHHSLTSSCTFVLRHTSLRNHRVWYSK